MAMEVIDVKNKMCGEYRVKKRKGCVAEEPWKRK